jgi:proton-dependent oligopeptide transporter, POT family
VTTSVQQARPNSGARPWEFPAGAKLVIAFEFCERVGFYSMVSLLVLFLSAHRSTGGFGWDGNSALTLLGIYSGLMYSLPVLGGWIADRFLGYRRALTVGGTLMLSGYVLITSAVASARVSSAQIPLGFWHSPEGVAPGIAQAYLWISFAFWISIGALIIGNALIKSTLVVALGDSFSGGDGRRERAYAYYYAGINLGGLVAGLIVGAVAVAYGWAPAFGISALAMGIALATYLAFGHRYLKPRAAAAREPAVHVSTQLSERGSGARLLVLAVFAFLLLVYSIGSFQLWGTMSLFLERGVNRHAGSFEIPTQWFTSVNAAALILSAPAFAALWAWLARRDREPDIVIKYALALALGAAGLLIFAIAAWPHSGAARPGWPLPALGVWVQATGEVAAWTVTYGLVYRLAPRRMVAAIMGAYYATTLGLGAYLAGLLGTFAERWGQGVYFLIVGAATGVAALIAVLIGSPLRSLAASAGAALHSRTG